MTPEARNRARWRREALARHCEMARDTLRTILLHSDVPQQLRDHAYQVLEATAPDQRNTIGTQGQNA